MRNVLVGCRGLFVVAAIAAMVLISAPGTLAEPMAVPTGGTELGAGAGAHDGPRLFSRSNYVWP